MSKIPAIPAPGIDLIKKFEGCHLAVYPDPLSGGAPYTVGWGSTRDLDGAPFRLGQRVTQEQADQLLQVQVERQFLPALERIPCWPELNVNQRGALLSFAYNLGAGFYGARNFETISRVLRERQWEQMEAALLLYRNPGSNVEAGLRRRRQAEADLFNQPVSGQGSGGSTLSQGVGYARVLRLQTPNLRGEDVRQVQQALLGRGIKTSPDGVFGPATHQSVIQFQRQHPQLTVDGVVGKLTWAALGL